LLGNSADEFHSFATERAADFRSGTIAGRLSEPCRSQTHDDNTITFLGWRESAIFQIFNVQEGVERFLRTTVLR
jgi:hypothetical protein